MLNGSMIVLPASLSRCHDNPNSPDIMLNNKEELGDFRLLPYEIISHISKFLAEDLNTDSRSRLIDLGNCTIHPVAKSFDGEKYPIHSYDKVIVISTFRFEEIRKKVINFSLSCKLFYNIASDMRKLLYNARSVIPVITRSSFSSESCGFRQPIPMTITPPPPPPFPPLNLYEPPVIKVRSLEICRGYDTEVNDRIVNMLKQFSSEQMIQFAKIEIGPLLKPLSKEALNEMVEKIIQANIKEKETEIKKENCRLCIIQ